MADPTQKEENFVSEKKKSAPSNPEARHEAESIDFEPKNTQGSAISRLFKPKGHRKAASLKALRSEDEQSQLDTFPEGDIPQKQKDSGLQDIPPVNFTNTGDEESQPKSSKPSFFSRLRFNWFSKGRGEVLQEEDSQNITNRNVSLKAVKKTKLEGAYDTEREFMESVMTEKNVMDSYRVDEGKTQARNLVNSGSSKSMKVLTKVLIASVILLLVGGLILGGIYIKNNTKNPQSAHTSIPSPKVSFSEFGKFTKTSESFKPEEVLALNTTTSPEKETIFKNRAIYFNSEQQIQQRVMTDTNFVVKRHRRLQDGKPNILPETRTEKTETEEMYRMVTYKNAAGNAESIISFEGLLVNGNSMLPGTQQLANLQDLLNKHPELNSEPAANGGTRLLQSQINKLRKLQTTPTFSDMNSEYTIDSIAPNSFTKI